MLEQEIQKVIESSLPAQVGDVLKKRLEQADKDAVEVKSLTKQLATVRGDVNDREAQLSEYSKYDTRNRELDKREEDLNLKVRLSVINELQYQLESEKDKTTFTKELAMGLVRNTEYRRELFDNQNRPSIDHHGNQIYTNSSQSSTETITNK
jgi:hypothetical protein